MTEALQRLSERLGLAAGDQTAHVANHVVMAAASAVAERARQNAPRRSGRLVDSIQIHALSGDTVQVIATAPYSGDVERGTAPHTIVPARAKVLAFTIGGRTVFARAVHHPGTRPQPFMAPAVNTGLGDATEQLGQAGVSLIVNGEA